MSVLFVWCLEKCVVLFGSNSESAMFDVNSVVSFGTNSLKLSILFDMKSEKVFAIVGNNCLKVWILLYLFCQMFYIT